MDDPLITIDDVRKAGFCARGVWEFARDRGWDRNQFRGFVQHGLRASELRQMGEDGLLDRVIETKMRRQVDGRE